MLTTEQKKQFSDILEELGKSLDITKEQHDAAVTSYEYVGRWLAASDSPLSPYKPEIRPQGSFLIGTMIKPIHEDDELDIDIVCRLEGKRAEWTQFNLKQIVGERLAAHGTLKRLLKTPDGRRCWTLRYADSAKFHLDTLPAIVSSGFQIIMERAFSDTTQNTDNLAIRITDNKEPNYSTEINPDRWPKSNPFGYGVWFKNRAELYVAGVRMFSEAIQPVPKYQTDKLPLQRVVQILKRHRDMMFNGDEDKPISIIITTLSAWAYEKQTDIIQALLDVVDRMPNFIEERFSAKHGRIIKWIANPVNPEENFADKWPEAPQKEKNFYRWLTQVKADLHNATGQQGLHRIQEALEGPFGKNTVTKAFSSYGEKLLKQRESGAMKMAAGTGILSSIGRTTVPQHQPFGGNE